MSDFEIERNGNRAIIRKQGNGPYELAILVDVDPLYGTTRVAKARYNHRTMTGDGEVSREGGVVLDIPDWLTVADLIREIVGGQDLGPDRGVGESGGDTREPVPDAIPARAGTVRRPA